MGRYITTKADFTLRRKHKKGSGSTIYENDYTTINPMPNALKGEYVIGDSNFVFTSRLGINGQKKHVRGKFVPNPIGEDSAWTIDTIIDSGITNETKIRLKPNYNSIRDFACYGSAVKLVQGTINGVIRDFPAEMYLSDETITFYNPEENYAGYSFDADNGGAETFNRLYNEYQIDITTQSIKPESVTNQLRFFALCASSYTYLEEVPDPEDTGKTIFESHNLIGFEVEQTALGKCYEGKNVWVDKIAVVTISFEDDIKIIISIFKDNEDGSLFYTYSGAPAGGRIRPKKKIIEDYFRDCDDFTATLLNRDARPIYKATFETPRETDTGLFYEMKDYVWPTLFGGYNPDLSGPYYAYVESLISLGEFYDEYFSDNMWRSLTHEAIKTLDWTYVSNSDGDIQDLSTIDTSRIEPITKIYGRQFDDLKRYADGIKSINTITYNQRSNTPDYTLIDVLENSGWETKTLKITSDNDVRTKRLYKGISSGYTASDANNEFLRRLKLNSNYLFSAKGTRKGLDAMLAMFGFTPEDYDIHEYVYVFSGESYPNFCKSTSELPDEVVYDGETFYKPEYPLAKDVSTINKYKINFNSFDAYGEYCGIPVTEVGYFVPNPSDSANPYDYSYVVPWYSQGKNYDDGLYFQMHGGWGKRNSMDIDLEIAPDVKTVNALDKMPLYMETQARLKFAKDFDDLLQEAFAESHVHDVFYVTDISDIITKYTARDGENLSGASHYFILENLPLSQYLGYSQTAGLYGWRSIDIEEIQHPDGNIAGTLVLYLESIRDDTTGNNPHTGNGTYDDGMAYVSGMSEIFAYSLVNKNFMGIDDETCSAITEYKFDVTRQEDNRKCWFFSDDYNFKYGKNVKSCNAASDDAAEKIYFREVEVTDEICDIKNCNDSRNAGANCNGDLYYDLTEMLRDANAKVEIGKNAPSYFISGSSYGRNSEMITFDPEKKRPNGDNGEAAANSIVNVKNLRVHFNLPSEFGPDDKKAFRQYIEATVLPYLTQMIPSTSILALSFDDDENDIKPCRNCDGKPDSGVTENVIIYGDFVQDGGDVPPGPGPEPEIINPMVYGDFEQIPYSGDTEVINPMVYGDFEQTEVVNTTVSGDFEQTEVVNTTVSGDFDQTPVFNTRVIGDFEQTP